MDGEWPRGRYRRPRDNKTFAAAAQSERKVADREAVGGNGQEPTTWGENAEEALWEIVQYVFRSDGRRMANINESVIYIFAKGIA